MILQALTYAFETATDMFNTATYVQAKTCAIYLLYAVYETQALYPKMKVSLVVDIRLPFIKHQQQTI